MTANFYLVSSTENSTVAITIFYVVCFQAVPRGLDDISKYRLTLRTSEESDFHLITALKITLVKFTFFGQCPKIPSLTQFSLLAIFYRESQEKGIIFSAIVNNRNETWNKS